MKMHNKNDELPSFSRFHLLNQINQWSLEGKDYLAWSAMQFHDTLFPNEVFPLHARQTLTNKKVLRELNDGRKMKEITS